MNNDVNHRINKGIVIIIILSALSFYNFNALGNLVKLLQFAVGIGMIFLLLLFFVYQENNSESIKQNFKIPIFILLISLVPNMIVSAYFHDQSIFRSIYEQRDIYFYLSYFLLHKMRLEKQFLERLIFYFGIVYVIFYVLQYAVYPNLIFDVRVIIDRNTLRIGLTGFTFALLAYFFSLHSYFVKRGIKFMVVSLAIIAVSILMGGRQIVFMLFFVTILYLIINKHVKYKSLVILLSLVGIFLVYLAFEEIIVSFVEVTKETTSKGIENVRLRAIRYFILEFFPNKWTYIFGNGNPSITSPYGRTIIRLMEEQGFFISDIGIFGVYVYYGFFFVVAVYVLLFRALLLKTSSDSIYIKYYLLMVLQATLTGTGFIDSSFIVVFCIMLYLLDVSAFNKIHLKTS